MSREKKLREYAESRLSAYADGGDSLARLKEEQRLSVQADAPKKTGRLARRLAFGFSAVAAVVVSVVCIFHFVPFGGGTSDTALMGDASAGHQNSLEIGGGSLVEDRKDNVSPKGSSSYSHADTANEAEMISIADGIADRMLYVEILLGENDSIQKDLAEEADAERYFFSVSRGEVVIEGILSFGELDVAAFPYLCEEETVVAGQSFRYETDGALLRGKIVTDGECIYISRCEGGTEDARFDALRQVFLQK